MQSPTTFGATAKYKESAKTAAVAGQDMVLNGGFAGVAYRGGGSAAAWTAETTSRLSKSPLLSIRRSVLENFPPWIPKKGRG